MVETGARAKKASETAGPQIKHVLRPRLLALVLALALTWYTVNPAPGPVRRSRRRPPARPDEKRREEKRPSRNQRPFAGAGPDGIGQAGAGRSAADGVEELDWPEYL